MRKPIFMALIAAAAIVPVAAQAQSDGDVRHDRREVRHEQHQLRDARRDERRDVRQDDRARAWGRDDWRGWRDHNPSFYARGNWNAPFRYTAFRTGLRIAPAYYGTRYVIADPWRYRLPRPGFGRTWVRHYNDVVLVDTRRGIVVDVIRGFYR